MTSEIASNGRCPNRSSSTGSFSKISLTTFRGDADSLDFNWGCVGEFVIELTDADADIGEEDTGTATFGATLSPLIAETRPAMGDALKACASLEASFPDPDPDPDPDPVLDPEPEPGAVPDSGSGPSGVKDIIRRSTISNPIRGIGARDISRCPIRPI